MDLRVRAQGATRIELAAFVVGLAVLVLLQLVASGSWSLLTQTPWLDECLTLLVVNDASFQHGLAAIRGGVENTPPAYFTVVWPIAKLFGGLGPISLRAIDCFFILLACAGVYATCRVFAERQRSVVGALVVAAHPAVVVQLFQVRFYGFWLMVAAWLVYTTARHIVEPESKPLLYARCVLAALVVTSHWFGIIALGLITAGELLVHGTARARVQAFAPMIVGSIALGLCLPLLMAQRSGLSVPTWIDPLTPEEVVTQARVIFGPAPLALLGALGLWRVLSRRAQAADTGGWRAMAPGLALLIFPVVLTLLSVALQPVLRAKYMIPTVIPVGMLAAFMSLPPTAKLGRQLAVIGCVVMGVIGAVEMRQLRAASAADVAGIDRAIAVTDSLRAARAPLPIVFIRRFEQHPVLQQRPEAAAASALVDFEGDGGGLPRLWIFERNMARRVNRVYPQYRLARVDDLARLQEFLVVARAQDEGVLRRLFPGHDISRRSTSVYAVVRR